MSANTLRSCQTERGASGYAPHSRLPKGPAQSDVFLSVPQTPLGHSAALEPDTVLGRFVLQRHIGSGRLGHVYLALDRIRARQTAIKVRTLAPGASNDTALLREKAAYDCIQDHRHVLKVHDVHLVHWEGTDLLVLSMEYADGGTLREWLRRCPNDPSVPRAAVLGIFRQVCRGVATLHRAGVNHLDLKPENVLLVADVWKVADFGLALPWQDTRRMGDAGALERTADIVGTPEYMSPEQRFARAPSLLDARSDVFSLGIILYEMLHPECKRPSPGPFGGVPRWRRRPRQMELPGIDSRIASVLGRCLAADPADRFASAQHLLAGFDGRRTRDRRVHGMWEEACRSIENRRWPDAEWLCREILQERPGHRQAQSMLRELESRGRLAGQLYATIEQDMDHRNLEELEALLSEAVAAYSEHPAGQVVQVCVGVKARQYRSAMQEGYAATCRGNWSTARTWFKRARDLNPGSAAAQRATRFILGILSEIREARERIDQAVSANQRERAMALARELDEYLERIRQYAKHNGGSAS